VTGIWVGKEEVAGVPAQPRQDLEPPPYWRVETVAYTPRPRSLSVGAGGRLAVFVQDAETSDVFLLDLEAGGVPEALTAGRALAPYWEDTTPRVSPDGRLVAYGGEGHVWLVPTAGGPPRPLTAGSGPVWAGDDRLVIAVDRGNTTRLAVVDVADPWPRRLARTDDAGDESDPVVSPDGTRVAFTFGPREDLNRSEIRVAD
jgi:Tol biopolymer transport system component